MKLASIIFVALAIVAPVAPTLAHSPIKATSPKNSAKLDQVPEKLHLEFASQARVLKVVMTHSDGDASHETRLDLPTKEFVTEMDLLPEFMGAGTYKINWRALGEDGHAIKGEFSFEVLPK